MDLFRENRSIRIDKGKKDGLLKNQAVIGLEGAIGYIFNVDTSVSQVLVISDRYITVDAIVQRSRAWGVVEGVSIGLSKMKYLHRTDDVQTGDIIVTSGMDEVFPKGFPIGTVAQVKKEKYGVDQEVEVTPFVDPSKLEEVFVIIKTNEEVTKESNL